MAALRPRSPASRALALAILAVLVGLSWLSVIAPLRMRYQESGEALANGTRLLARLRGAVVEGRRARADDETGRLARYRRDFLTGAEDAIIVADLQTRLSALATARAAEVVSARGLPPQAHEGLEYLGLQLTVRGEMRSLQQLLYTFETMTPLLFIERAALRPDERAAGRRDRGGKSLAPMTLVVDVYGAKWPGLTPDPRASKTR